MDVDGSDVRYWTSYTWSGKFLIKFRIRCFFVHKIVRFCRTLFLLSEIENIMSVILFLNDTLEVEIIFKADC